MTRLPHEYLRITRRRRNGLHAHGRRRLSDNHLGNRNFRRMYDHARRGDGGSAGRQTDRS
jgi:hypothetical protein